MSAKREAWRNADSMFFQKMTERRRGCDDFSLILVIVLLAFWISSGVAFKRALCRIRKILVH